MILLALNPLSKGVAISEMLILLLAIAFIGFLLGRWVINTQNVSLKKQMTETANELNSCQKQKNS
ncbi:hypothetical protein [Flectobacillus longus]|jgi:general stress protein CsbA|uniref:Lipopolysaccharide assembly protein A domain-containing protein n=1 Tax=Flectobacillus longus TaxID=2984207 RepID=A0ABT6YSR6_9BACT|nr:hypothetical protein [Flectobacillus longus]MDI9866639.1 hypothetical protein [Flectobacillus longus]MDI9881381.1 hypothetical protein [Flectobacillus longus]